MTSLLSSYGCKHTPQSIMSHGLNQVLDVVPQKYEMPDSSGMGLISIQTAKQPKKSFVSGLNANNSRIFTKMTHRSTQLPTQ